MFEIIDPGSMTTVQDIGRQHGQSLGIPPSGAQDSLALRIANLLVGNGPGGPLILRDDPGAAGLEILLVGPRLRAVSDCVIAITGAEMSPKINGKSVPQWQALPLRAGDVLAIGTARTGVRAYLAFAGGIDVPLYLGSRATHVRGGFGGWEGRALKAGDRLSLGAERESSDALIGRKLRPELVPNYPARREVRAIAGPDDYLFTPESVQTFFSADWTLNPKSDRTGHRYIGPQLFFLPGRPEYLIHDAGADPSNIVIDPGAPVGTIQVPSGVEPIVMGVDSPTIGGYARIGVVISIDMSRVGQTRPGEVTRFVRVDHNEALDALREQEALLLNPGIISREVWV
jgi:biotin-dependent carboxylase-like uncharacterized protein